MNQISALEVTTHVLFFLEPLETTEIEETEGSAEATVNDTPSVSESLPEQMIEGQEPATVMVKESHDDEPVTYLTDDQQLKDTDEEVTSPLTLPTTELAESSEYTTKSDDIESPTDMGVDGKQLTN